MIPQKKILCRVLFSVILDRDLPRNVASVNIDSPLWLLYKACAHWSEYQWRILVGSLGFHGAPFGQATTVATV